MRSFAAALRVRDGRMGVATCFMTPFSSAARAASASSRPRASRRLRASSGLPSAASASWCPARRAGPGGLILVTGARALGLAAVTLGHDLALVDPDLDADPAERRLRLDEAVVDVRADRVQRHAALGVGLRAAHLGAAEPSAARDLDSLGARAHRRRERTLHRATERHAILQLLRDRLRDELR